MAKNFEGGSEKTTKAREAQRPGPVPVTPRVARQTALQDIIKDFRDEWGEAPTIRDLCRILGIEWSSGMEDHLRALEKRGLLRRAREGPHGSGD